MAGIRTWNSLGRHVNRGEHGIAILAPCIYQVAPGETATADQQPGSPSPELAPEPSEPAAPIDGAPRQLRGFKIVHVFDVSQTDGDPLPDVEPTHLTGTGPDGLWDHLAGLVHDDGYRIERRPCGLGANGYTDYAGRVVRIRDDVHPAQAVKTLAHELGHIRADHEHRLADYATSAACRGQAEVEAESIAYLITAQAGLDSAAYSVPYLAGWSSGDTDLLRQSMTTAITAARTVTYDAEDANRQRARNALDRSAPHGPAPTLGADAPSALARRWSKTTLSTALLIDPLLPVAPVAAPSTVVTMLARSQGWRSGA